MVVDEMAAESKKGRMITHAIDSTTKKALGHLLSSVYTLAKMFHFLFHFLIFVEKQPKILPFKQISHWKCSQQYIVRVRKKFTNLPKIRAVLYNLNTPAGQLFGGTHTPGGGGGYSPDFWALIERHGYVPDFWVGFRNLQIKNLHKLQT